MLYYLLMFTTCTCCYYLYLLLLPVLVVIRLLVPVPYVPTLLMYSVTMQDLYENLQICRYSSPVKNLKVKKKNI